MAQQNTLFVILENYFLYPTFSWRLLFSSSFCIRFEWRTFTLMLVFFFFILITSNANKQITCIYISIWKLTLITTSWVAFIISWIVHLNCNWITNTHEMKTYPANHILSRIANVSRKQIITIKNLLSHFGVSLNSINWVLQRKNQMQIEADLIYACHTQHKTCFGRCFFRF